jgi:chromosome segregation ATPase
MLTARNLEKIMELEEQLRAEYQVQLDAKSAEIEKLSKEKEEQKAVIAKQLEQISSLSIDASSNKKVEQRNRELHQRCENLLEDIAKHKKRAKTLQSDLSEIREELATLRQFDPAKMKKNLDASKKKLAEKTSANELLQKTYKQTKAENAELREKLKTLEARLEELEPAEEVASKEEIQEQEAAA